MEKKKRVNKSKEDIVVDIKGKEREERFAEFNKAVDEASEKFSVGIALVLAYEPNGILPKAKLYDKKEEPKLAKV